MEFPIDIPSNPYLLLTPGPLSTSATVRRALLKDWCTWDREYNDLVQDIRCRLVALSTPHVLDYTAVLMQGSGTFSVESVISTVIPEDGTVLILVNGAYGKRMVTISERLKINHLVLSFNERTIPDKHVVEDFINKHPHITHVAMVHCETTTGILNDYASIAAICKSNRITFILDAMSSFGGIPIDVHKSAIDYLISSANKCVQGVPGFGFIIANKTSLLDCKDRARSHSLDLYDQWETMEKHHGKWRFTSPTHTVRAFLQALNELEEEGGIAARYNRYFLNQKILVKGMRESGFLPLLEEHQSPFITAFHYPENDTFSFDRFYSLLKEKGFVIYPGKVSEVNTFRIGNIGEVYQDDIYRLLDAVKQSTYW